MKAETKLYDQIRSELPLNVAMYRQNTGKAYQGQKILIDGDRALRNLRLIEMGLCEGSSDLIGWTTIEITPEMVGKKIAVFTALEVKTKSKKGTPEQEAFIALVREQGGIAGVVRNSEEAILLIENFGK